MPTKESHAVTGAFGYTGKYIARRLLAGGRDVVTLTNSPRRPDPFGGAVRAIPFNFDKPDLLAASLKPVKALYNTYWVRFNHGTTTQAAAVENTWTLFRAAVEAGVERIVHISITNPSEDSPLEYFRGKAVLERLLTESGVSYAILRPAVVFGQEDILIHNIAWLLRRLPVVGVFGNGQYRLQPISVDDLAELAVSQGEQREDAVINAIGPETFTYRELVDMIAKSIGKRRRMISVPAAVGYAASWLVGKIMGDVMVTWDEVKGLMSDLLYVDAEPAGRTRLSDWVRWNAATLGLSYVSELDRRRDRERKYQGS